MGSWKRKWSSAALRFTRFAMSDFPEDRDFFAPLGFERIVRFGERVLAMVGILERVPPPARRIPVRPVAGGQGIVSDTPPDITTKCGILASLFCQPSHQTGKTNNLSGGVVLAIGPPGNKQPVTVRV